MIELIIIVGLVWLVVDLVKPKERPKSVPPANFNEPSLIKQDFHLRQEEERLKRKDVINASVVELYSHGRVHQVMIPLKFNKGILEYILVQYEGRVDIKIVKADDEVNGYIDIRCIRIPESGKYWALRGISKLVRRYHLDMGKKIAYLDKSTRLIKELKEFVISSEYVQPKGLFPEIDREIYNLSSAYKSLHKEHYSLIFNVMKGDRLIGYTSENFPDISVTVAALDKKMMN
jgi:hypothetical protein